MRDDQVRSSQAPLYGSESSVTINGASPSPGRPEQHQTMLQTKPVAATTSSQWAYPRSPYPSSLLSLYNGLLSNQSEPDLFDLMHRPQATCVHLPEEDKELYTSSNTDFVVLSNIPAERFMNPFQRVYYQSRHLFSSPVIPTSVHQTPNGSIRRVQQSHVTQTALPSGVQSSKFLPDPKQDPVKHPHLTQVMNEEEQGKKKSGGEAGRGPGYTSSSAISSISQLLTAPEKNNNIPGSTGAQQNSHRRECVKCGVLFTPILELNGSKQLLCNSCGVIPPIRTASPDVRATPSPARGSPSPSPYKDKKKQMYPQRIDAVCSNCKTSNTSLWRRNHTGETVCNACGLYYKLHGVARPISMRKDGAIIRRRKNNKMVSVGD